MDSAPNTAPANPACVITCAYYDRDGSRHDIGLERISDALQADDGGFVWVGLYEPAEDVLRTLQDEFGLHDLAIRCSWWSTPPSWSTSASATARPTPSSATASC
jgi:hypothetical protein